MPNWKKLIVSGSDANLSSLNIDGNLTASAAYLTSASIGHLQTIYETASVIYSSGSTKFGDTLDDTHEITGSLLVTGSITGDLTGTASIANFATTSSQSDNSTTASFAITASYALNAAGGGDGGGGVGATNEQTLSQDFHVSASQNQLLLTPLLVEDGVTITVENDAVLYTFSESPRQTSTDSASVAISSSYAINATNAISATNSTNSLLAESSSITAQAQNNNTASGSLSFWQGSQAEYDLISASADSNTVYFVV